MKSKTLKTAVQAAGMSMAMACALLAPITQIHAAGSSEIYRMYNQNTGEHLYTASSSEKMALDKAGWTYEGIGWIGADSGDPVYRLYNPNAKGGDHYYTRNFDEASSLVRMGWRWDNNGKPLFYSSGDTPLYVAYNPNAQSGAHNYTTNRKEQDNLMSVGWKYDEVAWYVIDEGKPAETDLSLFKKLPDPLIFASGAGAWDNELSIKEDGSFTGYFHDSDYRYITECSYSGKFSAPVKVDDYTYTTKLLSLKLDRPAGQSWTDSKGITHMTSTPYGLEKGKTFHIYLPGIQESQLPSEAVEWGKILMGKDISNVYFLFNDQERLPFMGRSR